MNEQSEQYYELAKKSDLSASEQNMMSICRQAMHNNSLLTLSDVDALRERARISGNKIAALKEKLEGCKQRYDVYQDIDQLPVTIECKVIELQEEFKETRVVVEIVGLKADEEVLTDGKVDLGKVGLFVFDTVGLCYRTVGDSIGGAWNIGKKFE